MNQKLLAAAVIGGMLIGCQSSSPPAVITRLPQPATIVPPAPPRAVVIETPRPAPPTAEKRPEWEPAGGLSDRWTSIVIHHTASDVGSLRDIDQWHRDKGWDCCGYHFVIGNGTHSGDGQIEIGPRWSQQSTGAHTRLHGRTSSPDGNYYNEHGIGIVLVGNFDKGPPSARQLDALVSLVGDLCRTCDIPLQHIYFHGELKSTDCPGHFLSRTLVRRRLMDALAQLDVTSTGGGG